MKKLIFSTMMLAVTFAMCTSQVNAGLITDPTGLTIGGDYFLGEINPGLEASEANQVTMINALNDLAVGATSSITIGSKTNSLSRVDTTLGEPPFPDVTIADSVCGVTPPDDGSATEISTTGIYKYVVVKWDGPNAGTGVFYFADGVTGTINAVANYKGGTQYRVSSITLYGKTGEVPEPASIALMGLGGLLAGYGVRRRKQKTQELVS